MKMRRLVFIFLILVAAMVATALFLDAARPDQAPEIVPLEPSAVVSNDIPVTLYAYDVRQDTDASGNVLCSAQGIVPVTRTMPATETPLADALALLFSDPLTEEERARGLTTEFPLTGVTLTSVSVDGDDVVIEINDPEHRTSGGSCRISILHAQIAATAKAFGIRNVTYMPEDVFQP